MGIAGSIEKGGKTSQGTALTARATFRSPGSNLDTKFGGALNPLLTFAS
jgi:hypothetical protein